MSFKLFYFMTKATWAFKLQYFFSCSMMDWCTSNCGTGKWRWTSIGVGHGHYYDLISRALDKVSKFVVARALKCSRTGWSPCLVLSGCSINSALDSTKEKMCLGFSLVLFTAHCVGSKTERNFLSRQARFQGQCDLESRDRVAVLAELFNLVDHLRVPLCRFLIISTRSKKTGAMVLIRYKTCL